MIERNAYDMNGMDVDVAHISVAISTKRSADALERIADMMEARQYQRDRQKVVREVEVWSRNMVLIGFLLFLTASFIGVNAHHITAFINWITQ